MSMTDPTRMLNSIRIASPCTASWDAMSGDDTVRFCGECKLNVYNLSNMTAARAASLLDGAEGRLCVRLYRRADGTVITRDCPVGARAALRRMAKAAGAALAVVLGLFTGAATSAGGQAGSDQRNTALLGAPAVRMGDVAVQGEPATTMGKIAAPRPRALTVNVAVAGRAGLAGAVVMLTDLRSGAAYIAVDNGDGSYELLDVEPGVYSLTVTCDGFEPSRPKTVRVRKNQPVSVDVSLEHAPVIMGGIAPAPRDADHTVDDAEVLGARP